MRYFDLKFRKLCHYPLKPLQVAACYSIVWLWRYCGIYIGKKNIDDRRKKQVGLKFRSRLYRRRLKFPDNLKYLNRYSINVVGTQTRNDLNSLLEYVL